MTVNSSIKSAETILHCLAALNPCGFFTAPGSRNAPFLQTLGRDPLNNYPIFVHFDERALAFAALGAAKASQKPDVIITTSGTALGNLFPAVWKLLLAIFPLLLCQPIAPTNFVPVALTKLAFKTISMAHMQSFCICQL